VDKATKRVRVAELEQILSAVPSIVLTEYIGLGVEEITKLRRNLREANVAYKVTKNTLLIRAIKGTPVETLSEHLNGPNGIAFSLDDDPVIAAKVCLDFAKKNEKFNVKAGWVDGKALDREGVKALAALPTKDQLRGQLLALMNTPAQQLLGVFTTAQRDLLGVLTARQQANGQ